MKASLQIQPMYCSRDHNCSSRFNQQYEKSTPEEDMILKKDGEIARIANVYQKKKLYFNTKYF